MNQPEFLLSKGKTKYPSIYPFIYSSAMVCIFVSPQFTYRKPNVQGDSKEVRPLEGDWQNPRE